MTVSLDNSKAVYRGIKDAGIHFVTALPETWLVYLLQMADEDPEMCLIEVAKEEEAIGIAAGAYFAGTPNLLLLQNHGFLAANNITDTIPAERFVGPACVIDVSADVARDEDFLLTVERVLAWEEEHGPIEPGSWLLLRTDWSKRDDPQAFINAREDGPHTPGFELECARFLAQERDILGVGVETIGTDAGQAGAWNPPFPTHNFMHGAGKLGLASLRNLDQLPPKGAVVIAAPLKIVDGSGSPLRVLALAHA